jgi:hypothetical protein
MKHELRSLNASDQQQWRQTIDQYENSFRQMNNDFTQARNNANRRELLHGAHESAAVEFDLLFPQTQNPHPQKIPTKKSTKNTQNREKKQEN